MIVAGIIINLLVLDVFVVVFLAKAFSMLQEANPSDRCEPGRPDRD